jgi:hypothetical protein
MGKGSINPITNPNSVCSHTQNRDNTIIPDRFIRVADIRTYLEVIWPEAMDS